MLNFVGGSVPMFDDHAAKMFDPGPIMSGFRIVGSFKLGPLEEKHATVGAGDFPYTVPVNFTC